MFRWPFIRTAKPTEPRSESESAAGSTPLTPLNGHANLPSVLPFAPDDLSPHPIVALLPPRVLKRVLTESAFVEMRKGATVFTAGSPSDILFIILSGRCEARSADGAVVDVFGPGDTLGDRAFLNRESHRHTVVVATRCLLFRIDGAELRALFDEDPCLAGRFSLAVTGHLHDLAGSSSAPRSRRIVSFLSLAPRIDSRAVVKRLAAELRGITRREVLLVRLGPAPGALTLDDWKETARHLNGAFAFAGHTRECRGGFDELHFDTGAEPSAAEAIAPILSHCGRHYDYVVLHVSADTPVPPALECLIQSDLAYVLLQPSVRAFYDFELLMNQLSGEAGGAAAHVQPILVVDKILEPSEFRGLVERLRRPVHSFAQGFPRKDGTPDHRFALHMRRLAREIARCRIGLALSSGGAKGLAHIGVIQVLEENGIEIDCIAGSSMGAYVGAIWAHGADGAMLEKLAREIEGRRGLWPLIDPVLPPRQGFLTTRGVMRRLRRTLGDAHFSDLIRPLRVVATHLDTLERVVFTSGEVAAAVEASIAIPGIVVPVTIDGETLIDGGIADPLPVDLLDEAGIERIIAVNVVPPPEMLRRWHNARREHLIAHPPHRSLGRLLNRHLNWFADGNILATMLQAINGAQTRVAEASAAQADILLRPLASDSEWHDFTNPGKYIELGRRAALEQLPALESLMKGTAYETPPSPSLPARAA
ncbi:MAG: patatin-like phospholipase family protein [Chthoniobacteraceae bacterium]